jgi:hypothetical protein
MIDVLRVKFQLDETQRAAPKFDPLSLQEIAQNVNPSRSCRRELE